VPLVGVIFSGEFLSSVPPSGNSAKKSEAHASATPDQLTFSQSPAAARRVALSASVGAPASSACCSARAASAGAAARSDNSVRSRSAPRRAPEVVIACQKPHASARGKAGERIWDRQGTKVSGTSTRAWPAAHACPTPFAPWLGPAQQHKQLRQPRSRASPPRRRRHHRRHHPPPRQRRARSHPAQSSPPWRRRPRLRRPPTLRCTPRCT
jgi:hypothetical protein